MKRTLLSIFVMTIFVLTLYLPNTFAQDPMELGLPEGAKARFGRGWIMGIQYSPDGTLLKVRSSIGIWIYNAQTGKELNLFPGEFPCVAFSPDGQTFVSKSKDGISLWDVKTGNLRRTRERTSLSVPVVFSPDGKILATGSGGAIHLWDVNTGDLLPTPILGAAGDINSLVFSPDGQKLVCAGSVWDVHTGSLLYEIKGGSVAFSPDGNTLATSGWFGVSLWDVATGELRRTLIEPEHHHIGRIYNLAFSPDGNTLATSRGDNLAFSPDGNTLTTGQFSPSQGHTLGLWDVATGELRHTLAGHWVIESVAFSPDGLTLASGSHDKTIRLWDVATGELRHTLTGHTDYVYSVAFSPDGLTLASGSRDGTVLLWHIMPATKAVEENLRLAADVNGDGAVNIQDLVAVATALGKVGAEDADVNGDGAVNIQDLVAVAAALGKAAAAPSIIRHQATREFTFEDVQLWLTQARLLNLMDTTTQQGILFLEQLLVALTPKKTALFTNYPNPFNPETWIPYQLSEPADVTLTIYDINGRVIRVLDLGHQPIGVYQNRARAAYWDGKNAVGETVASCVYFYTLTAGEFTATRKMLIRK